VEFLKAIGPLTDPTAHGGTAADAFHVVIPSLPGYGFSDRPSAAGWTTARIASAWGVLMARLGYRGYLAQGGDWGGAVTTQLGRQRPSGLAAVHLNLPEFMLSPPVGADPTPEEQHSLEQLEEFGHAGSGYSMQQATCPQTLGYALADSPVGQAAWIYEKFTDWTDSDRRPERVLSLDDMLDGISLYWFTNTATSSARLYWESFAPPGLTRLDLPVGVSVFPGEIARIPGCGPTAPTPTCATSTTTSPPGGTSRPSNSHSSSPRSYAGSPARSARYEAPSILARPADPARTVTGQPSP
jgi:pimeloyl-ACP methyl ester carboxylesterase